MASGAGPKPVSDGLIFEFDAANGRSYAGTGLTANSLIPGLKGSLLNGVGFSTSNSGTFIFDGSNDYVDVDDFNFDFSKGLTICSFCYPTNASNWARIIDFGLGQQNDNIILSRLTATNNFFLEVRSGTAASQSLVSSSGNQFVVNSFHFLSGVVDGGTPGSGTSARLYYNGSLISSTPTGSIIVPNTINRTSNYIARSNWTADSYYTGYIYSILIYNRALSDAEIRQNYNATKGRYGL